MAFTPAVKKVTPKGTFIWPKLNEPDTKFDPAGVYETKIAFEAGTDLSSLKGKCQEIIDQKYDEIVDQLTNDGKAGLAKKVSKRDLDDIFVAEEDEATGEETGRIIAKAKMKASGVRKKDGKPWSRKPDIFDAKGNKLKTTPSIGGGTEGKLSVELSPYYVASDKEVGVSLRLQGAQIIKLVQFGARSASDHGFGEEDGDDLSSLNEELDTGPVAGDDEDDDL